jgi:hypothetical protein
MRNFKESIDARSSKLFDRGSRRVDGFVCAQDAAFNRKAIRPFLLQPPGSRRRRFTSTVSIGEGVQNAAEKRDLIAKKLTPDEIAKEQKLAQEWKPK